MKTIVMLCSVMLSQVLFAQNKASLYEIPLKDINDKDTSLKGHKGEVLLGDEICPDTCRYWDKVTREKLDKDRFRRDLGNVEGAYREMMERVSH